MRKKITVEELEALVQELIVMLEDDSPYTCDWCYACLEPALIESRETTLKYLQLLNKEEFVNLGEYGLFEHILGRFKSAEIYSEIEKQYTTFFGEDRDTDFYKEYIGYLSSLVK